jgi:hypothetical protein
VPFLSGRPYAYVLLVALNRDPLRLIKRNLVLASVVGLRRSARFAVGKVLVDSLPAFPE